MSLAREIDLSVCEREIDEIAQDVAALLVHIKSAMGVELVMPRDLVPPSEFSERLGMLVWAYGLLRCRECGALATAGATCATHERKTA